MGMKSILCEICLLGSYRLLKRHKEDNHMQQEFPIGNYSSHTVQPSASSFSQHVSPVEKLSLDLYEESTKNHAKMISRTMTQKHLLIFRHVVVICFIVFLFLVTQVAQPRHVQPKSIVTNNSMYVFIKYKHLF